MVGAAYTRFFRNVGDDRGLAGVRRRENPATNPVSVRELSRRAADAATASAQLVPFLNLWAAAWIQFRTTTGSATAPPTPTAMDQIPLAEDDPLRGVRRRPPRRARAVRGPDPPAARTADLPPTFLNEVTHWWDGSQLYGSDWETQARCARTAAAAS